MFLMGYMQKERLTIFVNQILSMQNTIEISPTSKTHICLVDIDLERRRSGTTSIRNEVDQYRQIDAFEGIFETEPLEGENLNGFARTLCFQHIWKHACFGVHSFCETCVL